MLFIVMFDRKNDNDPEVIYGPFDDYGYAEAYAEKLGQDWYVAGLTNP